MPVYHPNEPIKPGTTGSSPDPDPDPTPTPPSEQPPEPTDEQPPAGSS